MTAKSTGILDRSISDSAFAIVDFETTGLNPGVDRVVELAIVRKDPGREPQVVLDTLVNPQRPVAATEIHGITDEDVRDAPLFQDVTGEVVRAIAGCIVASYNVYFDMPFLEFELSLAGIKQSPPHLCLMYLRPMLGLGPRCALVEACRVHGIPYPVLHVASADGRAAARLMEVYLDAIRKLKLGRFADLMELKSYKFVKSFYREPLADSLASGWRRCNRVKSRHAEGAAEGAPPRVETKAIDPRLALSTYWDALTAAVADLEISDQEIESLQKQERELGLRGDQVHVLHARVFANAISQFVDDERLDREEREKLHRLHQCLARLGWAPGLL